MLTTITLAPTSASLVVLSNTRPLRVPEPCANKDCDIVNINATNAHASLLRVEVPINIFFSNDFVIVEDIILFLGENSNPMMNDMHLRGGT